MSAALYDFPAERVVRRPEAADDQAVTLTQAGESLTYPTPEAYWAAARDADPELKRRLAAATAAAQRAADLSAQAQTVLRRAAARGARRREMVRMFQLCILLGFTAAVVAFACGA